MKKEGYYSSGEFAQLAHVTLRTIRFYDKKNILKPSLVTEGGTRFYTEDDLVRLQQILLLKYLGFSLDEISGMLVDDNDYHFMLSSLNIQLKLVRDRIEQMQLVEDAIQETISVIGEKQSIDWSQMLNLIHLTGMEKSLKNQYQDASNISARIRLHSLYSKNPHSWFSWLYDQMHLSPNMRVLEIGCGDGTLWSESIHHIPQGCQIVLSDISDGMLRDARRNVESQKEQFEFKTFDCQKIPFENESFDLVIANHVLFYCEQLENVCSEVQRVLRKDGRFLCSTYGKKHMQEVSLLAEGFDDRIALSGESLYEKFGKENGKEILSIYFSDVQWNSYEDELIVPDAEPLISYILSCHGNQGQYILDRYKEFQTYVKKKVKDGFHITKDAGIFISIKSE